ncbi:MAG: alkaline phosphatase family protein [Planctomycetota bacterium]
MRNLLRVLALLAGLVLLLLLGVAVFGGVDLDLAGRRLLRAHSLDRGLGLLFLVSLLRLGLGARAGWRASPAAKALPACAGLLFAAEQGGGLVPGSLVSILGAAALAALYLLDLRAQEPRVALLLAKGLRGLRRALPAALVLLAGAGIALWADRSAWRKTLRAATPPPSGGAESPGAREDVRLLLIGLDGANWTVARPLIERGELPHLARLMAEGHSGPLHSLRTFRPTVRLWGWWSAVVWATIATGYNEEKHGIRDFSMPARGGDWSRENLEPAGRKHLRAEPFWEVLAEAGVRPSILGWWDTFPAVPFAGELVTLRFGLRLNPDPEIPDFDPAAMLRGLAARPETAQEGFFFPPDLLRRYYPEMTLPKGMPEVDAFIRTRLLDLSRNVAATDTKAVATFRNIVWQDLLFKELARAALKARESRLVSFYCEGTDTVQHHYWQYRHDPMERLRAAGEEPERLRDMVDNYYRLADEWVGQLLEAAGPGWDVLIVSDHGHGPGTNRRRSDHAETGLYIAAGPDFRHGTWPSPPWTQRLGLEREEPSVLDVAPTILYLFGLPVAADCDGSVRAAWLRPGVVSRLPLREVPTYRRLPGDFAETAASSEAYRKRLQALGYTGED